MTLDRYLMKLFFPIFSVALSMFMLLLCIIDIFVNLPRYLANEVAVLDVFRVTALYIPQAISYALPVSLLFASAYTLGDLYAKNELTSIFAAGIPFWRFCRSLLIVGMMASFFSFFFDDFVVIPTVRQKNELARELLNQQRSDFQADIVVRARGGMLTYTVDFFDALNENLFGVTIIEQNEEGAFLSLIRAHRAIWNGSYWEFTNAVIYDWNDDFLQYRVFEGSSDFREEPDTFRRNLVNVEELRFYDARHLANDLRAAGLPFLDALANFYQRFSFATVAFVTTILSISMGGRFRKNIMLMSLISSLGAAVVFYVTEMITMMMGRLGYIHPITGAWFPVFTFIIIGILLLRTAKT